MPGAAGGSVRDEGVKVQSGDAGAVEGIDRRDPAVDYGEGKNRDGYAGLGGDEAGRTADDRRVRGAVGREEPGAGRYHPSALDELQRPAAVVGAQENVRIQHRQQG